MDWRDRFYYLVDFDADFHNKQIHELKQIFSVSVFSRFRGHQMHCVSVSKERKQAVENMLEKYKQTSETKFERFWKEYYIRKRCIYQFRMERILYGLIQGSCLIFFQTTFLYWLYFCENHI